ncbi:MAG: 50S ribosomal protein L10 [Candidatus Melainabacteria bacterium GWF2_37_15]|nr:MAG: 50S ribosomal protein L10 [Candidatus Melainabacteria bacterium GWF2_37_15]
MATKAYKQEKIQEIRETASKAKVAIVSDYRGLTVFEITDLRRRLQAEKGDYTVIKNTLAKIAFKGTGLEGIEEFLKGPSAIAFGFEDQVSPAKVLTKFIKEKKKTEIRGGILDGRALSSDQVRDLSNLPSKEELYAKMLGSISSPASGIVYAVNGVMQKLVIAMEEVRKQKEK